jgi:hypothetical protein
MLGVAAYFGIRRGDPEKEDTSRSEPAPTRATKTPPGRGTPEAVRPQDADEDSARTLYEAAEAFERAQPAEVESRIARWRQVVTQHPTSPWARKADEKHRAAAALLEAILDRDFEDTCRSARTLAAAGHFNDAIETLQSYRSAQTRALLKRRADVEISALENGNRLAYNEAASKTREFAAKGDFEGGVSLFQSVADGAIPEVAAHCQKAIAQLKEAAKARDRYDATRKGDDARRAFREEVAPKILSLVQARRYEEALKEMGAAAAAPANAAIRDEIIAERASVVDASSFWEAFLRALRSRVGQEASLLLSDGRKVAGRISRVQEDKVVVETGETSTEALLDRLHPDLLVGWTLGKTLAAEDGLTYVRAGLFFFCEGRDDLARLYLSTARELKGPVDAAEHVFRGGFLRAAVQARK